MSAVATGEIRALVAQRAAPITVREVMTALGVSDSVAVARGMKSLVDAGDLETVEDPGRNIRYQLCAPKRAAWASKAPSRARGKPRRTRRSHDDTAQQIVDALTAARRPLATADIAAGLALEIDAVRNPLQRLVRDGRVRAKGATKARRYWISGADRIAKPAPEQASVRTRFDLWLAGKCNTPRSAITLALIDDVAWMLGLEAAIGAVPARGAGRRPQRERGPRRRSESGRKTRPLRT